MKYFKIRTFSLLAAVACVIALSPSSARAADITPSVLGFKQSGPRTFEVVTSWKVGEAAPSGDKIFVHITCDKVTDNEGIVTQCDPGVDNHPDKWKAGATLTSNTIIVTLPASAPDGNYEYKVGIFDPSPTGARISLNGADDGDMRYPLFKFTVSNGGQTIVAPGVPPLTPAQEGRADIVASIVNFQQSAPRQFSFQLSCDVKSKIPEGNVLFMHVTILNPDPAHDLITAAGADGDTEAWTWPVGQKHVTTPIAIVLPDSLADGSYNIRVGFWTPNTDKPRLALAMPEDGQRRYVVGTIVVSGGGTKIALQ